MDHLVSFMNPPLGSFLVVGACDCVFIGYFTLRRRAKVAAPRREPLSLVGIVLQGIACGLVGNLYRAPTTPLFPMPAALASALAVFVALLAIVSIWLCIAAASALGKQWTYLAQVGNDRQLVTRGPYSRVRHPIYAGMTGLLIASAMAIDRWPVMPVILVLQITGTWIRMRTEDRLLRLTHGPAFIAYAAKVPAIVPRLFGRAADG